VEPDGSFFILGNYDALDLEGDGNPDGGVRCDNDGDIIWARYQLPPR
jgi:hypothetical protein